MATPVFSYQSKLLGDASPTPSLSGRHARNTSVGGVRGQWEARVRSEAVSPLIARTSGSGYVRRDHGALFGLGGFSC